MANKFGFLVENYKTLSLENRQNWLESFLTCPSDQEVLLNDLQAGFIWEPDSQLKCLWTSVLWKYHVSVAADRNPSSNALFCQIVQLIIEQCKKTDYVKLNLCVLNLFIQALDFITRCQEEEGQEFLLSVICVHSLSFLLSFFAVVRLRVLDFFVRIIQSLPSFVHLKNGSSPLFSTQDLSHFCSVLIRDADPRIRKRSIECLTFSLDQGVSLDGSYYRSISDSLTDDYEGVRLAAMSFLFKYSQLYSGLSFKSSVLHQKISISENTFILFCNLANDYFVHVRVQVFQYLGMMKNISPFILGCTLTKKLFYTDSELLTQDSPFNDDTDNKVDIDLCPSSDASPPHQNLDVDSQSLLCDNNNKKLKLNSATLKYSLGSSITQFTRNVFSSNFEIHGVFILGLEDEYFQVRNSVIDAIYSLSLNYTLFFDKSLEFLINNVNDEIDSVRLNTISKIYQLTFIQSKITFNNEHMTNLFIALNDSDKFMRESAHKLIENVYLKDTQTLKTALDLLISNLSKYPEDLSNILLCCKEIGSRHSELLSLVTEELLNLNTGFLVVEPQLDDMAHTCKAIAIINASFHCREIIDKVPKFLFNHYIYYLFKYPQAFGSLENLPNILEIYHPNYFTKEHDNAQQKSPDSQVENLDVYLFELIQQVKLLKPVLQGVFQSDDNLDFEQRINYLIKAFDFISRHNKLYEDIFYFFSVYLNALHCFYQIKTNNLFSSIQQSNTHYVLNSFKNSLSILEFEYDFLGRELQIELVHLKLFCILKELHLDCLQVLSDNDNAQESSKSPEQYLTLLRGVLSSFTTKYHILNPSHFLKLEELFSPFLKDFLETDPPALDKDVSLSSVAQVLGDLISSGTTSFFYSLSNVSSLQNAQEFFCRSKATLKLEHFANNYHIEHPYKFSCSVFPLIVELTLHAQNIKVPTQTLKIKIAINDRPIDLFDSFSNDQDVDLFDKSLLSKIKWSMNFSPSKDLIKISFTIIKVLLPQQEEFPWLFLKEKSSDVPFINLTESLFIFVHPL